MWRKPVSGRRANPPAESTLASVYQSSGKEKESCCLVFPSSTKREIRHFIHVVVVQRRLRNVQKSLMHVQSCCFANLNPLLLCRSRCRRPRRCLSSLKRWPGSEGGTTITAEFVFLFLMSTDRHVLFVWLAGGSVTLLPVATFPHVKGASFSDSIVDLL